MVFVMTLTPRDQATSWIADVDIDARVTQLADGTHQCTMYAPHPMAEDIVVRVLRGGVDRAAALAAARTELLALGERAFADPSRAGQVAADAREAHLYRPTVKNMARVRRAVIARGYPQPQHNEIQRAAFALKIDRGHADHLIAEVVDQLLADRRHYEAALNGRPAPAQTVLL